jgi:hypothetical protein
MVCSPLTTAKVQKMSYSVNGIDNEGEYKYGTANALSYDTWNQF